MHFHSHLHRVTCQSFTGDVLCMNGYRLSQIPQSTTVSAVRPNSSAVASSMVARTGSSAAFWSRPISISLSSSCTAASVRTSAEACRRGLGAGAQAQPLAPVSNVRRSSPTNSRAGWQSWRVATGARLWPPLDGRAQTSERRCPSAGPRARAATTRRSWHDHRPRERRGEPCTCGIPGPSVVALISLWQKSTILARPNRSSFVHLTAMAMGKRPAARQASPMWVDTADLPTSDGHPFFERLNRVLEEAGFDAFVEELCAAFYAARMGRPSLRPGRYFRLLVIGYFEGLSSERGIAWRVADSLSLRSFLDLDVTEAAPDHSTLSRTRRLIDVETHVSVFTWVLERLADAGLVRGKTVGIDATALEANAAMRSIERRDTGESYEAFVRSLAEASGVETPTRADLARFDRSRKNKKTSNKEWKSPQDPDAKIAKMKDGRTHMAHKAEHGVDLDTGAIVSVTVQDASDGDTATLPETLIMAAEQVELVQPDGPGIEEVVADKGYHSDETLVALGAVGVRSHVSEPERGRRCWQDKKTGETPPEKRAAQKALYANRRRVRGRRGRRLQRCRGEVVERTFAHLYETGGMRRVWVRGHENVRKRVLIQAAACNIGLLLRRLTGVGTPRSLQGRALSAICRLIGRLIDRWGRLTRAWGFKWTPTALVGSIAHRQAA